MRFLKEQTRTQILRMAIPDFTDAEYPPLPLLYRVATICWNTRAIAF
jgi:hypothetical protein